LGALELGIGFLSSGFYYRAATMCALEAGITLTDEGGLARVASCLDVRFQNEPAGLRVLVAGEDRTDALREPSVTSNVRFVAENAAVRGVLGDRMRAMAACGPILAEGRDMGSVVFPGAIVKFFLNADLACRARRRRLELQGLGTAVDEERITHEIAVRDRRDATRETSPLVMPKGAVEIDTSNLSIAEVVSRIVETVRDHGLFA
jgi:cytidylate kinase